MADDKDKDADKGADKGADKDADKGADKGGAAADRATIREIVREVLGERDDDGAGKPTGRRRATAADEADDIAARVEAAVGKVRAKEAAEKDKADAAARLKALEEKVTTPPPQPKEFRRATRFMRWASDDD